MNRRQAMISVVVIGIAGTAGAQTPTPQQRQQDVKGMEKSGQRDDMTTMTAAQQAEYKSQYQAAKAKWASLTPEQKKATIAAARSRKLSDLSYLELVGQRDDMKSETAAQAAQNRSEAEAAKAKWNALTPAQKQAVRKSAWSKKRGELEGLEAAGQRDDSYVLPY